VVRRLTGAKGHICKYSRDNHNESYALRYPKREAEVLSAKMYYNDNVPCLGRKYNKIKVSLTVSYEMAPPPSQGVRSG